LVTGHHYSKKNLSSQRTKLLSKASTSQCS